MKFAWRRSGIFSRVWVTSFLMKVLLVKLGAIGDIVHALPALAALRRELPDAEITWAVEKKNAEILRENPMIDHLVEIDTRTIRKDRRRTTALRALSGQASALRKQRFDVTIDLQGLIKSAMIAKISGAKRIVGFGSGGRREPASRMFLTETVKTRKGINVIRKNMELIGGAMGFDSERYEPEFPIAVSDAHRLEAGQAVNGIGHPFAILNPGGGWVTKLWPAENFGILADILNERGIASVIVAGPNESDLAVRAASAAAKASPRIIKPGLKTFYALAELAAVYVGGDTGPTHIAVAAGTPIVGIFGPTEWWRNGSPRAEDICVERTDIGCRVQCHRRTCSNWICMDIDVKIVADAVAERLAASSPLKNIPSEAVP